MPLARSVSMLPTMPRSRSASMSSLAQVDLSTLNSDVVLDYARKVMQLQPQPATSAEKLQMLFALSQKLLKWLVEDREQGKTSVLSSTRVHDQTPMPRYPAAIQQPSPSQYESAEDQLEVAVSPLPSLKPTPSIVQIPTSTNHGKLSFASKIWATASTVVTDEQEISPAQLTETHELEETANTLSQNSEFALEPIPEKNEPSLPTERTPLQNQQVSTPEPPAQNHPPKRNSLQIYLEVQRSVVCIQKNARGYMARRKFFQVLEELLQGRD